jgi:integrase
MSAVFRHGIRLGFLPGDAQANPMKFVRQSGVSTKEHNILTKEQIMGILAHHKEPVRTMARLDVTTGLRANERLALQRDDGIDVPVGWHTFRRSISTGSSTTMKM